MIKMLLVVFAIQIAMFMYMGPAGTPLSLYTFLTNPTNWENDPFFTTLIGLTGLAVGIVIAVGTYFMRSDIAIFGAMAATLLTFGFPLADLYSRIASETGSPIPAMLFVSPIILTYCFTTIQWWRIGAQT